MNNFTEKNSTIGANNLFINKVFSDDFEYNIPNYQRPYSWEEEQALQLLDDIGTFAFKGTSLLDTMPYFLGSIVIIKKPEETCCHVVDGQQRLTTLTILLACLRYLITNEDDKTDLTGLIYQKGSNLKGTKDTFRLKTRKKDQAFFKKLIQDPTGLVRFFDEPEKFWPANESQQRILSNAKALIHSMTIEKKYSQEELKHLTAYIIQKCTLVVVISTDEDIAFRVFNVLNDRGLDLSIADILKSEIIEKIPAELQDAYTLKWENAEETLGIEHFKTFFSHVRTIYAKRKAEKGVLTEVRDFVRPSERPVSFIDEVLQPYTEAFQMIRKHKYTSHVDTRIVNQLFKRLARVAHTDWYPPAILFLAKNKGNHEQVKQFFEHFDALVYALEGMSAPLNERLARFANITRAIENKTNLFGPDSPLEVSGQDKKRIMDNLSGTSLYGKRMLKPVLAKIEEALTDLSVDLAYEKLSIEHILPQKPTDDYWKNRFSIEDRLRLTNCLGNLSLIAIRKNIKAKNHAFDKKIYVYFKDEGKASNLEMVNQINTREHWVPERIEKRTKYLISIFLKAVCLPTVETVTAQKPVPVS